jgi:hypothetical protein
VIDRWHHPFRDIHQIATTERDWLPSMERSAAMSVALSQRASSHAERSKNSSTIVLVAFALMMEGTPDASADSKLPDPITAGVAEKLFRLDCGRSVANDESVWTPCENVGRPIEYLLACKALKRMVALGYGCS